MSYTYATLQTAVASWLARADLTSLVPQFIEQAEEEFNNTLRMPQMESRVPFTIDSEYETLPNDFLEVRHFHVSGNPSYALQMLGVDQQTDGYTSSGMPKFYSVIGNTFRFAPSPDGTYTGTLNYYAKIPPLALNTTNWLLARAPSVYLYQSILQGLLYIQDDQRAVGAVQMYDRVLQRLKAAGDRARWGGASMATRAG